MKLLSLGRQPPCTARVVDFRCEHTRNGRAISRWQNLSAGDFLDFRLLDPFVGDAVRCTKARLANSAGSIAGANMPAFFISSAAVGTEDSARATLGR
jgi:hypothetical protein